MTDSNHKRCKWAKDGAPWRRPMSKPGGSPDGHRWYQRYRCTVCGCVKSAPVKGSEERL